MAGSLSKCKAGDALKIRAGFWPLETCLTE